MTTAERDDQGGESPVDLRLLLLDQREANENLVLATVHAQELREEAERAAHLAEEASRSAEVARKIAQALVENCEKRARELRATAEFREQLLAIVGHDLRNPLNAIAMSTELLGRQDNLSEPAAKLIRRVRNSVQRMTGLIGQLLEFTRTRLGGGLVLSLKPTDFREVCRHVIEELEVGSRTPVQMDVPGELIGTWDEARLAQVLSNIAGNAADHATAGTAVLITAWESSADAFIEISNQGDPIPLDMLSVIFQPFRQGRHQSQAKEGHLGLGLYIAHQIVLAHGGELTARSSEGTTTFSIRLPLIAKPRRVDPLPPGAAPLPGGVPVLPVNADNRGGPHHDLDYAKRTDSERAESDGQFRAMIEWLPQLAWWARSDGYIDYYNPPWYAYTGTTPKDMQGWGWRSVHDPKLLPEVMARWQRSITSGEPFEMEFPLRRHDGAFRWFLTRVMPIRDASGRVIRWVGINTDIEDQKTAFVRLSETIESMSDAFTLVDRDWRFQLVNRNHERMSQTPRTQSLGRVVWEMFPAAKDPAMKYWDASHRAMDERVEVHFVDYYPPTGLWTEVDIYPSHDGIAVFWRDISERKQQELQRELLLVSEQEARSLAESASRAKDEFLAMLGHELRNPLAPILTALQLMRLRGETVAERERSVIERQVKHLVRLVDDLLDVSRITRGTVELSRQPIDLADVTARAVESASPLIAERSHTLSAEIPRGLVVHGDIDRLAQVVSNLLNNAAKYTPTGGRITFTAQREAGEIALSIHDTGVGITPDLLPRVFDLFVQGRQGIDRAQGGLGLGLAIVRRLIELHGGRVSAASDGNGRGSTFTLHLPAIEGVLPIAAEVPLMNSAAPRVLQRRMLIVDDNKDAADLLAEVLEGCGYATSTAYDGPSALASVDTFKPDIAVLDIGLPGMDGYELARQLRQHPHLKGLRLVALTGYGQEHDRQQASQAGFDAHLVKPVDIEKLTATLELLSQPSAEPRSRSKT